MTPAEYQRHWRKQHPDYHRKWMAARRSGESIPRVYQKHGLSSKSDKFRKSMYEKGRGRYKNIRILGVLVNL